LSRSETDCVKTITSLRPPSASPVASSVAKLFISTSGTPAASASRSFHSRKLTPSTASTSPLTTPPKRVAMPPFSTAEATPSSGPPSSGSSTISSSRSGSIAPRTTFDARDSSPDATFARRHSNRCSSNP
jgi:hypothetical protein